MKVLPALALTASLLLAFATTAAAATPRAGKDGLAYAGETAQGLPISLVLTANRKTIKRLDIMWVALPQQCSNGLPYVSMTTFGGGFSKAPSISSRKRFRHSFSDSLAIPDVMTLEERPLVRGIVGRTRASGTFRATAVVKDAAGAEINRCDTGTIRWAIVQ